MRDTPKTDKKAEHVWNVTAETSKEWASIVPADFAREMETDAREYKMELAKALDREATLRRALGLARQYIAGEFGFENWRIGKVDEIINKEAASVDGPTAEQCNDILGRSHYVERGES